MAPANVLLLVAAVSLATACQGDLSPDRYSVGPVGEFRAAVRAKVVSAVAVQLSGSSTGVGARTGAVTLGLAGAGIGRSSGNVGAAVLGGILIGAVVGAAIEEASTRQNAMVYVVELDSGPQLTILQFRNVQRGPGEAVSVEYGPPISISAL